MTLESFLTGKIYILIECQNHLLFQKLSACNKLFCFSANINTSNKNQDIKWNAILFYNFIFGFTSDYTIISNPSTIAIIYKWYISNAYLCHTEFVSHINIYLSKTTRIHWFAIHTILEAFSDLLFLVGKYRVIQLTDLISYRTK